MTSQTEMPESKFVQVIVASRRARQLMAGAPPLVDNPRIRKATRLAYDELRKGALEYSVPEISNPEEDKEKKRRRE